MNSKLLNEIKPRKQANELPKSDEHSDKLINQLNHCKTIANLCKPFNYRSCISEEESLVLLLLSSLLFLSLSLSVYFLLTMK